jgi:Uncharacterised nucleotidyltransferase
MISRRVFPFDLIARVLAERLRGSTASDELLAMVHSRGVDWERIIGHASAQFVLPALAAAMRDLDLIGPGTELGAYLGAVHAANLERNSAFRAELATAVSILNEAGIEPVLLKGAIRLAHGLYPDHGWRVLRDVDLLVPRAAILDALRALQEAGYLSCESEKELRREGGACQIDLHRELFSAPRQVRLLAGLDVLRDARPVAFPGGGYESRRSSINSYTSSATARSGILATLSAASVCATGWRSRRWSIGATKRSIGVLFSPASGRLDIGDRSCPRCCR